MYPRLDAGETGNPETPVDLDKSAKKLLLSKAKAPGKGATQ